MDLRCRKSPEFWAGKILQKNYWQQNRTAPQKTED